MDRETFNQMCAQHPDWLSEAAAGANVSAEVPATFAQLQTAFPTAKAEFIVAQLKAGASISAARQSEADTLRAENVSLTQQVERLNEQLSEFDPGSAGLPSALNTAGPSGQSRQSNGSLTSLLKSTGQITESQAKK